MNETVANGRAVAFEIPETRQKFLNNTYYHLLGAILLLIGIEVLFFKSGINELIFKVLRSLPWLIILGIFMVITGLFENIAKKNTTNLVQYFALFAYVAIWAIMLVLPLTAAMSTNASIVQDSAVITLLSFAFLTAIVMFTGKDFSFLRNFLIWGGVLAIIGIAANALFKVELTIWFSIAMLAYSGAAILYNTSNIIQNYPKDRYVNAALSLFSSIALMFWYVAQIFLGSD